jgi:LmbE family N-acetylglucosaminyl deacetylase
MTTEPVLLTEHPGRLLVVAAHPDDADLAMAGAVAAWSRRGTVAHLVCCTSGDASSDDVEADPLELAAVREEEQRAAASIVGYVDVTFLHRPEGALANDLALREQLVRIIRTFRPDAVAAPDPRVIVREDGIVSHVDHREAGAAALDAVFPAARAAMAFPHLARSEGLAPHVVGRLYLMGSERPNAIVDIATTLDLKVRALRAHASQAGRAELADEHVRSAARILGAPVGLAAAEAFTIVDLG